MSFVVFRVVGRAVATATTTAAVATAAATTHHRRNRGTPARTIVGKVLPGPDRQLLQDLDDGEVPVVSGGSGVVDGEHGAALGGGRGL